MAVRISFNTMVRFTIDMLASGGLVLLLDQWSKRLVNTQLGGRTVSVGRLLLIRRVANRKSMYGRGAIRAVLIVTWLAALASAVLLSTIGGPFQSRVAVIALGSALGGAAGNLLDILRRRPILDFIDLRWWPVFNLADVAIAAGVVLAFWPRA
jgi:signal peptidase II